jgi:hypothetical protein
MSSVNVAVRVLEGYFLLAHENLLSDNKLVRCGSPEPIY